MSEPSPLDLVRPAPPGAGGAQRPRLLANTVYAIVGVGFFHVCQLGALVLLAKFASAEIQGQYILALAIATPVLQFFGFELRGALVADAGRQFTVGTYHALRRTLLIPAGVILAGVLALQVARSDGPAFAAILASVFAMRLAWAVAEVGWGAFQRRERLDLVALAHTIRGLGLLVPLGVLLLWPGLDRALGAALGLGLAAVAYIVTYFVFDRPRTLDPRLHDLAWDWRGLRALAVQTFPLGLVALAINLCDTFPRWVVESRPDGTTQLGYFGALAYITLAGNLVIIQATHAAANRLALFYQRDLRAFLRLGARLLLLAVGLGAALLLVAHYCGAWLLRTLYTAEYARYTAEFKLIVLANALALLTNLLGAATTQMRLFWIQVPVQVLTLGATAAAALLLIRGDNLVWGAGQTALVRAAVQLGLYALCVTGGIVLRRRLLARGA